jgi:formamidopyrimidine-DNA glycosylase
MPELPEVESVKLSLEKKIIGKKIVDAKIYDNNLSLKSFNKMFRGVKKETLLERITGSYIESISRKGKYLIFNFKNKLDYYKGYVHLGMAGALLNVDNLDLLPKSFKNPKNLHVKMILNDGSYFIFSDIRRFGKFVILPPEEFEKIESIKQLGPEPFGQESEDEFVENLKLKKWTSPSKRIKDFGRCIKIAIMDQSVVSGVGNIYACESLFLSGIDPRRSVSSISEKELRFLFRNFSELMKFSIEVGGTSISDYINGEGMTGSFQNYLKVYGQKKCFMCGSQIQKIELDRTTHYCPSCQK